MPPSSPHRAAALRANAACRCRQQVRSRRSFQGGSESSAAQSRTARISEVVIGVVEQAAKKRTQLLHRRPALAESEQLLRREASSARRSMWCIFADDDEPCHPDRSLEYAHHQAPTSFGLAAKEQTTLSTTVCAVPSRIQHSAPSFAPRLVTSSGASTGVFIDGEVVVVDAILRNGAVLEVCDVNVAACRLNDLAERREVSALGIRFANRRPSAQMDSRFDLGGIVWNHLHT